ncbi:MAG: HNH endonuclease [Deltaproteobacteria bacterium]|nr:HNH endonuclease [Deltaproteobacteria bacterium]
MKLKSFFVSEVTEADLRRERSKARELRRSQWWKNKRARGVCYFCGERVPPAELTMEHVVPLVRGGKSIKSNLVPACKSCNTKKKYLLPIEWEEYLDSIKKTES